MGLGRVAYIHGITGNHGGAHEALNLLHARRAQQYVLPSALAIGHLGLGERDQCLSWLQLTCESRLPDALLLHVEPLYDAIRDDARFPSILHLVGLPPGPAAQFQLQFSGALGAHDDEIARATESPEQGNNRGTRLS